MSTFQKDCPGNPASFQGEEGSSPEGDGKGRCPHWAILYLPLCWLLGLSPGSNGTFPSSRRNLCNVCPPWSPISWSLWHGCGPFPQSYQPAESEASPSPLFAAPKDGLKLLDYIYSPGPTPPSLFSSSQQLWIPHGLTGFISRLCHLLAGRS